jgi:uncharacterized protein HemX
MSYFMLKAWAVIKKNWKLIIAFVAGVAAVMFLHQQSSSFADKIKEINDAHEAEIKKIEAARLAEERKHEEDLKKLQDTLAAVEEQYAADKKSLDDKKRNEITQLVKQYKDDPVTLSQKLSDATGFRIIYPS